MLAKVSFDHKFSGDASFTHFEFDVNVFEAYILRKKRRDGKFISKFFRSKTGLPVERRVTKHITSKMFESLDLANASCLDIDRFSDPEGGEGGHNDGEIMDALAERVSSIQLHHGCAIRRRGSSKRRQ